MGRPLAPASAPTRPEIPKARVLRALPPAQDASSSAIVRLAPPLEPASFVSWVQEQITEEKPAPASEEVRVLEQQLVRAMRDRNTAQALMIASVIVYHCPEHAVARRIKGRCAQQQRGATRAFPRKDAIPRMRLPWSELEGRNLPGRAVFLLSCLDGASTVEQIIDVSAMPLLVAYETLDLLVRDGIVELT